MPKPIKRKSVKKVKSESLAGDHGKVAVLDAANVESVVEQMKGFDPLAPVVKNGLVKPVFQLTVSFDGNTFDTETDDLPQAFLDLKPQKVNSKVVIKVSGNGKNIERWLYPARAKRLFNNRLFAEIYCKQLNLLMK